MRPKFCAHALDEAGASPPQSTGSTLTMRPPLASHRRRPPSRGAATSNPHIVANIGDGSANDDFQISGVQQIRALGGQAAYASKSVSFCVSMVGSGIGGRTLSLDPSITA